MSGETKFLKMKNLIYLLFIVSLFSCKRYDTEPIEVNVTSEAKPDITNISDKSNGKQIAFYYHDGLAVTPPIDPFLPELHANVVFDSVSSGKEYLSIYTFSTRENAISWGINKGYPIDRLYDFEDRLTFVADSAGLKDTEDDNKVPNWYSDYSNQYFNNVMNGFSAQNQDKVVALLFKDKALPEEDALWVLGFPANTESFPWASPTFPSFLWMNKKGSSYWQASLFGGVRLWKKTFYGAGIGNIWIGPVVGTPSTIYTINFSGPLAAFNDAAKSGARI
jgi:hypothetical protein